MSMQSHFPLRSRIATLISMALLMLGASAASALPALFDPAGGFLDTNLGGLPGYTIDSSVPFLDAGDVLGGGPYPVDLTGSTDVCILFGDSTCRANTAGVTGAYSVLITAQISAINTPEITGPFTLLLTGLASGSAYSTSDLTVDLNPVAPVGLDTSGVPGFGFDGTFSSLLRVTDETFSTTEPYYFLGSMVELGGASLPDSVTWKIDVAVAPPPGVSVPQLTVNAIPIIPEPGTALLMGLGLAGLASVKRR